MTDSYSLYLFEEKVAYPKEVAFMLNHTLKMHKIDANRQVRYCRGCLHRELQLDQAQQIQNQLKQLKMDSFFVLNEEAFLKLRPKIAKKIQFFEKSIEINEEHLAWERFSLVSLGVVGLFDNTENILTLPAFQSLEQFNDGQAKQALKSKVVDDVLGQTSKSEPEKKDYYVDFLLENPFEYYRVSREHFQFHWLKSDPVNSSLLNLRTFICEFLEHAPYSKLTPNTHDFLKDPYQTVSFFESTEHLMEYTQWFFQKTKHIDSDSEEKEETFSLEEIRQIKFTSIEPSEQKEKSLQTKVVSVRSQEEEEKRIKGWQWLVLVVSYHSFCVVLMGMLMTVTEGFLANVAKNLPRGLPTVLRESLGLYYYHFFSPVLLYVCLEFCFVLGLFPKEGRDKTYKVLMILISLVALFLCGMALFQSIGSR